MLTLVIECNFLLLDGGRSTNGVVLKLLAVDAWVLSPVVWGCAAHLPYWAQASLCLVSGAPGGQW